MITKEDIGQFLLNEREQKREEMKEYYLLPVEERVKKRKCIAGLRYDKNYKEYSNEYSYLYRFTFTKNISDLKVGDYVLLLLSTKSPAGCQNINGVGMPIVELGNDYVILSSRASSIEIKEELEYTIDATFFDSRSIDSSFLQSNEVLKEKWLRVINEVPQLEFMESPHLEQKITEICHSLGIKLTDSQHRAIIEAVTKKEYSLIQGPPGTGKTFVIAIIAYLLCIHPARVIISSSNHMAINNVLCKIHKSCAQIEHLNPAEYREEATDENKHPVNTLSLPIFKIGHSYQMDGLNYMYEGEKICVRNLDRPNVSVFVATDEDCDKNWIIGVTPQALYTSSVGLHADVIIIEEAGQLTIPTALMAMQNAEYAVLVGDHKQLPPILSYDEHPEKLQQSIFQALYRDYNCVTLDKTYRLNGQLCQLISESFYDGKLESTFPDQCLAQRNDNYPIVDGHSVYFKDIKHNGTCSSEEEAEYIVGIVEEYISRHGISADQIAVIAPFRAQCALIRRKLRKIFDDAPVVDTIDRMQGQERDIIIYSFTAGDYAYAAELVEFLYNPNKINVAVSRARSKLIMVGNKACVLSVIRDAENKEMFRPVLKLLEHPIVKTI